MQLDEFMVSDLFAELSNQEQEIIGGGAAGPGTQAGPPQYSGYGPLGLFGPGGLYSPDSSGNITIPGYGTFNAGSFGGGYSSGSSSYGSGSSSYGSGSSSYGSSSGYSGFGSFGG